MCIVTNLSAHKASPYLLTPGEVDQVKLPDQLLLRLHVLLLDVDEEDAVAAGAVLVHV